MSFWKTAANRLGKSLGLLGKPYFINNLERKFGAAPRLWAIQVEWPSTYDDEKEEAEEAVILLTPYELERAIRRGRSNPEDVVKFLDEHAAQDGVD